MKFKPILIFLFSLTIQKSFSQGGGPPMLTTDPGTPGNNHWEINAALGFHIAAQSNTQIPTIETVYGIGNNFQFSAQLPMPNIELKKTHSTSFSQPSMGVKYRFLDEEKNSISVSVYPQMILPLYKDEVTQIFIPIQFEKTFNNFRIGEEIGYFVLNNPYSFFNGTIVGYHFKNELELMSEFYWSKTLNKSHSTSGLLNLGFRKPLNKNFMMMSSLGTELITPTGEEKQHLFGLVGMQILLGK